ncbi:hypothetical protein JN00_0157 [Metamycoplasma subdolum]|uniref:Cof subfamily protein (Haloacid dehalogenase superfamily)/HAD superfamily hydrolase (TIGR01484 family) n=1 Tax=Metamycoplasma subdolum TaxID=92407 RepID=A0A3M0A388_9BACT|nr:Cof-type HAD-IIB family hydrolase [Metamycoplasma subdolum]RMA79106.1 hypothetical protein JN00_0157 [Metamycoplasma subdolum]WPB50629.1 Cof-type HAD-IIB family hydrolase [Metamycoplasma subdolum]
MLATTNNKKPIIFSDIDGTLYTRTFHVMDETLKDIEFAIKNGADFNLCTGNPFEERMQKLIQKVPSRYFIGSSGAQVIDLKTKETIYKKAIDFKIFQEIYELSKKHNYLLIFWDEKDYYFSTKETIWLTEIFDYHFTGEKTKKIRPKLYSGEKINPLKIEVYAGERKTYHADLEKFREELSNIKGIEITHTFVNLEILEENVSKGDAIVWMSKNIYNKEEIQLNEYMTIGDSNNDLSMIELTDFSYAMSGSSEAIIKTAKYHTSAPDQNGVGEAILDYLYRFKNVVKKYMFAEFEDKQNK